MASPIVRGGDLRIDETGIRDVVRLVINPIWNAYSFFTLYANADNHQATFRTDSTHVLDQYIIAKTRVLVDEVTASMDTYDLPGATSQLQRFIDALNNWYIRRSRDRFWAPASETDASDKRDAYDTLFSVLLTFTKLAAPLLPLITEEIYQGLVANDPDAPASVHLADWPDATTLPADADLVVTMDRVRDVASTALNVREDHKVPVRVPLATATVAGRDAASLEPFTALIADEINVKEVRLSDNLDEFATFVLQPDGARLGPRLGGAVKEVFAGAKSGDWTTLDDGRVNVAGHDLDPDDFELGLVPVDGVASGALGTNDAVVVLDTEVTDELRAEGWARTFVRLVQQARKDADFDVTDRIELIVAADDGLAAALRNHGDYVSAQVLAVSLEHRETSPSTLSIVDEIDGLAVGFNLARVAS